MSARASSSRSCSDVSLAQLSRRRLRPPQCPHRRISLVRHGVRQPRLGLVHPHQAHLILHDPGEDASVVGSDDSSRGMVGTEGEEYSEVPAETDGYGGGGSGSKVSGLASELAVDGQRLDKYGAI